MRVLAGDLRKDTLLYFGKPDHDGPFLHIYGKRVPLRIWDVTSVELVTQENHTSIVGKAAWGGAGLVLLGPLGLLAGVLGGGNHSKRVVVLTLRDGRSALLDVGRKDFEQLQAMDFEIKSGRAATGPTVRPQSYSGCIWAAAIVGVIFLIVVVSGA